MSKTPWVNFISSQSSTSVQRRTKDNFTEGGQSYFSASQGKEIRQYYDNLITQELSSSKDREFIKRKRSNNCRIPPFTVKSAPQQHKPSSIFKFAESGDSSALEECLRQGLNINECDFYGWTPLMCASCAGNESNVKFLIKQGAHVDHTNKAGANVLQLASQKGYTNIVNILSQAGKSCNIKIECDLKEADGEGLPIRGFFCDICKVATESSKHNHESSIIHILNSRKTGPSKPSYLLPESNVGYQLMLKLGWDQYRGLGPEGSGKKYPVKTQLKQDRLGLGNSKKSISRVTHFKPFDVEAVKSRAKAVQVQKEPSKRERLKQAKKERQSEIHFRREFY